MKSFAIIFLCSQLLTSLQAINSPHIETNEVPLRVTAKAIDTIDLGLYPGVLLVQGLAEYSLLEGNDPWIRFTNKLLNQFLTGEIHGRGNFIAYEVGGMAAPYLAFHGHGDDLIPHIRENADRMFREQIRTADNLMTSKTAKNPDDQVFIDIAFIVTPYFLYSGLLLENQDYIDYAVFQTLELFRILKDKQTGLVHQARGYNGAGNLTEDNWSRGNGWGAFALAALMRDLPGSHPERQAVEILAKDFFKAVIAHQNSQGLWYQEMTDPDSYIETSGSGLLLHAIGVGIEVGILPQSYRDSLKKGLQGYLSYISLDGSVSNTCIGCLAPGNGTKTDYAARQWKLNDSHAFGPVVLAFTQARKLGIDEIALKDTRN